MSEHHDGEERSEKEDTPSAAKTKQVAVQIQLDPQVARGTYVNLALINSSENEFVLDFAFVQPQTPKASVASRVILAPRQAKRLAHMLTAAVERYERHFGVLDGAVDGAQPEVRVRH
ncbi:MAG: hypothetical protein A2284_05440 [Deltaproteobacteria bacterium RIFOXYA12_FULL_61_11]|nr:MAG: hypothetical protein A2284_05440 [Deltaproteobacteria bacterium RIFOXYA12_FULL_61_11]